MPAETAPSPLESRKAAETADFSSRLDTFTRLKGLVLDSLHSPESRRAYGRALDDFLAWALENAPTGFQRAMVQQYRAHLEQAGLSPAAVNLRLSAIRKLAREAADNGLLAPELAAGIVRVPGIRRLGSRTGSWLTLPQAEQLIAAPAAATLKGKRDRAVLAVLIGCGLRRRETAALTWEHFQQREGRWVILDLVGKGGRIRTVPVPSWAKAAVDVWTAAAGIAGGLVFRSLAKGDRITGERITPQGIFELVHLYGAAIGEPNLAPHDLRRTFAKLAHRGKAALEQIQLSLGHASITTTERYLGVRQDLADAPCDHLGLRIS
jgi:integrase